jgi:hypothetical protein
MKHKRLLAVSAFGLVPVSLAVSQLWSIGREYSVGSAAGAGARGAEEIDESEVTSVISHGDDFLFAVGGPRRIGVCDAEADHNPVKARYKLVHDGTEAIGEFVDDSDPGCVWVELESDAFLVQICERNHLWWVCSNWHDILVELEATS